MGNATYVNGRALRRSALLGACLVVVAACGGDVRATKITPKFLEDPAAIQKVANRLPPEERTLLGQYVVNRAVAGTMGLPPLVNAVGKDPQTVAEAIDMMRRQAKRNAALDAISAERDAKDAVLMKRLDELRGPMESAGYASGPTAAYNAVVAERDAMLADYSKRWDEAKSVPLYP